MARLKSIVLFIAALSSVAAQPPDTPELKRAPSTAPHLGAVWSLAFTPDSKILISAGADRTIRLWNVETGTLLRQIQGHADAVWSVAVAPRGRLMASGGEDGTVALWEVVSGKLVRRIDTRQGLIRSVAFSPDGQVIASGGLDNSIRLWHVTRGELIRRMTGHRERITCLSFSPNGKRLASGSWDQTVRIWEPASGKEIRRLESGLKVLTSLAFAPDSKTLLAGSYDANPLLLWDVEVGKPVREIDLGSSTQTFAGLAPDGRSAAAATISKGNAIRIWDAATGRELRRVATLPSAVQCFAFSPDNQRLAAGDKDGNVCVWDNQTGRELAFAGNQAEHRDFANIWLAHGKPVAFLSFAPDGKIWASADSDGQVRLWTGYPPREAVLAPFKSRTLTHLAFTPDSRSLAVASSNGGLRLFDVANGRESRQLPGPEGVASRIGFSADGTRMFTIGGDRTIRIWQVGGWKIIQQFTIPTPEAPQPSFSVEFQDLAALSRDGQTLAFADPLGRVRFGDVATRRVSGVVMEIGAPPTCLRFGHAGRTLAVGKQGSLEIWEIASRSPRQILTGFNGAVCAMQFSSDGRRLAAATTDRHAYLWDLATGKEVHVVPGAGLPMSYSGYAELNTVHIFPDGRAIAVASTDDIVVRSEFPDTAGGRPLGAAELSPQDLEKLWKGFEGTVGVDQIIWQLVACHERSVPFLVDRLREIKGPQIKEIPHLIRDLDNDRFTVRSSATQELRLFGDLAEPALLQTLQKHPSLEVQRRIEDLLERVKQKTLPAPRLRVLRALEAIEQAPASVAQQALESLSTAAASDWVRQEARSSLRPFLVKRD